MIGFAALDASSPAWPACAPIANGAGVPPSGTTVTCSGTTTNQNGSNGYGDSGQDGLTINVQSGATVTGASSGIAVNNNNTIDNSGTVTGVDQGISSGTGTTVINRAGALITGNTFGGVFANGNVAVTNDGTIRNTVNNGAGVSSLFGTTTVTNNSTGVIEGDGAGILNFSTHVTVTNAGRISGTNYAGISTQGAGSTVTVTNYAGGLISGPYAINNSGSGLISVTNYGTLTGTGSGVGIGIYAQQGPISVTNYSAGTISGGDTAIQANNAIISATNYGTISGGTGRGIWGPGGMTVNNYGTVSGTVGIDNSGFGAIAGTTIFNAGTVTGTGGTAINFAFGFANTLTIAPTSVINGNVVGNGSDIFQLGGSGTGNFNLANIGVGKQYDGFAIFNKVGDSTWILSGTGTQSWNVQGGTLGGNFTVEGLSVANGGTLAPGNPIGTFNVNGNISFAAGSIYAVDVTSAGQNDKIVAAGTATLTGGTVQVHAITNSFGTSTTYTILTANGGVIGAFSGVTDDSAFLTSSLSYNANNVLLTLVRSSFLQAAQTPNQIAVANAVESDPGQVGTAVLNSPTFAAARNAFDLLSGEIHPTVNGIVIADSAIMRGAMLARMRQFGGLLGIASLSAGGPTLSYSPGEEAMAAAFPVKAPRGAPVGDYVYWAQVNGGWGRSDGDGNAAAYRETKGALIAGVDRRLGSDWRAGLATGYGYAHTK